MKRKIVATLGSIALATSLLTFSSVSTASAYDPCPFLDEIMNYHLDQGNNDFAAELAHIGISYGCGFAV
jgi:hypothetical protein